MLLSVHLMTALVSMTKCFIMSLIHFLFAICGSVCFWLISVNCLDVMTGHIRRSCVRKLLLCGYVVVMTLLSFFPSVSDVAGDAPRLHFRRCRGIDGEARHGARSAPQGGPGAGCSRAQRVLSETVSQRAQSHRAAPQTGRTGGESAQSRRLKQEDSFHTLDSRNRSRVWSVCVSVCSHKRLNVTLMIWFYLHNNNKRDSGFSASTL